MQSFSVSVNAVAPMFLIIMLGLVLKRVGVMDDSWIGKLNGFIFRVLIPATLFNSIYTHDLANDELLPLLAFCVVGTLLLFVLGCCIVPRFEKHNADRNVIIQALYRTNFLTLGIPVITAVYSAAQTSFASIIAASVSALFGVLSEVINLIFCNERGNGRAIFRRLACSPIILACAAAYIVKLTAIKLPGFAVNAVGMTAAMFTPAALLTIGAGIELKTVRKNLREIMSVTVIKLVLVPALALGTGILLGFRGVNLGIVLALFASPTSTVCFTTAKETNGNAELAAGITVMSALLGCVTMFLWIFILLHFKYL